MRILKIAELMPGAIEEEVAQLCLAAGIFSNDVLTFLAS